MTTRSRIKKGIGGISCIASPKISKRQKIYRTKHLSATNLAFRNGLDPHECCVHGDDYYAHEPEDTSVVCLVVAEDNGKDNTAKVASGADETRKNTFNSLASMLLMTGVDELTIGMRVNVGYKSKVGTVTSLEEDGHDSDETNHLVQLVGIELADDDEEDTGHDTNKVDPELLGPQAALGPLVDQVTDKTAKWAGDDVEKTEHGCPATGGCLAKVGEVLKVVCAEDGVDGQFTTEGAEVTSAEHDGLK